MRQIFLPIGIGLSIGGAAIIVGGVVAGIIYEMVWGFFAMGGRDQLIIGGLLAWMFIALITFVAYIWTPKSHREEE